MSGQTVSVLFVCMGNICRSPMAESLFRHHARERGLLSCFRIDSAGTGGWHRSQPPDERMQEVGHAHGVQVQGAARQIDPDDLHAFDHVLCMDSDNLDGVNELGSGTADVRLMLSHHPGNVHDVPDPYYGGGQGFETVFELLDVACQRLLDDLTSRHELSA